jgi:thioredoxin reductase (NADPH)
VIVATGSGYRELGVPNEKVLAGTVSRGVRTCDGFFFRDQDIVVVGGGDTAMEEATFLTRFARSVTIVHRRDSLRASKIMQERAFANEKIRFVWDSEVLDVLGDKKVTGVKIRNVVTGEESTLDVTGLFVAIGTTPQRVCSPVSSASTARATSWSTLRRPARISPGCFACGDVVDHVYRQAITAAGTGCAAALDAERYLTSLEDAVLTGDPVQAAIVNA